MITIEDDIFNKNPRAYFDIFDHKLSNVAPIIELLTPNLRVGF